jgi:hypothetical protein
MNIINKIFDYFKNKKEILSRKITIDELNNIDEEWLKENNIYILEKINDADIIIFKLRYSKGYHILDISHKMLYLNKHKYTAFINNTLEQSIKLILIPPNFI